MNIFSPLIDLFCNISAGTRAALFMPIKLWMFRSSYLQICLLLVVSLGLSFVHDYFDTAPDNYFNPYGLSYQALLYLLFFFSLSLIAVFNSRQRDLPKLIVLFLSIVPIIWLGTILLLALASKQTYFDAYQTNWVIFIIYSFWYLVIVSRLIKRFFYIKTLPTIAYMLLYATINFTPLFLLPTEPLWYPKQSVSKQAQVPHDLDIETIYYSQNNLLKEKIDELIGNREGITDLFFIGFAGDADEDVFMNEVIAVQKILNNYFDVFGRSLALINNKATVSSAPLANGHNLKASIKEIATLMNTEEDILFLFLTSHGSEDHYISANFPPFKLNDINASTINQALDNASIKWRVIVISACYSGGLIDALTDSYTLLITAASADRNSFGCGHDGKYTYFGEAYFENGLSQTKSFIKAFDHAKEIISNKEKKEGFKNSNPQIRIGSKIESKLIEYEKRIETKGHTNWASTIIN